MEVGWYAELLFSKEMLMVLGSFVAVEYWRNWKLQKQIDVLCTEREKVMKEHPLAPKIEELIENERDVAKDIDKYVKKTQVLLEKNRQLQKQLA
jgi:hypothetical protein